MRKFDADLLFTYTDSLTSETKIKKKKKKKKKKKNVYEEFFKYKDLVDFIEYKSKFFDSTIKKVIAKMKEEFKGIPINKFTVLFLK